MSTIQIETQRVAHEVGKDAVRLQPPLIAGDPAIGRTCIACGEKFQMGDWLVLLILGPGRHPNDRERATSGKMFSAVAVEAHGPCITGSDE